MNNYKCEADGTDTIIHALVGSREISASGNGPLDALCEAIKLITNEDVEIFEYSEHALERSSTSKAVSYIAVKTAKGISWGVGVDSNINTSSMYAFISAVNRAKL